MKNKALFLDLDGTIIETKSGNQFPINIYDWKFKEGVLEKIKEYKEAYFNICIVTNQGGIELKYVTDEEVTEKLDTIVKAIADHIEQGINYAYCGSMNSYHRKPNPGMAYQLALSLELSLRDSVMVGDMESDAKFAKNAYIGTYLDIKDFLTDKVV